MAKTDSANNNGSYTMMAKPARARELIALSNDSVFNNIKQYPEGEVNSGGYI